MTARVMKTLGVLAGGVIAAAGLGACESGCPDERGVACVYAGTGEQALGEDGLPARETALYNIDPAIGALLLQSPPNDGVQQTKGLLGLKLKPTVAFDIMADGTGRNVAYALADKTLYTVDLASGKTTRLRDIKKLPALIDIAVLPAK